MPLNVISNKDAKKFGCYQSLQEKLQNTWNHLCMPNLNPQAFSIRKAPTFAQRTARQLQNTQHLCRW